MIVYNDSPDFIKQIPASSLRGFFVGWPNSPSPETHRELLQKSSHVVVAVDDETGHVVGHVTALSDGVLFAYISGLEVLPAYQKQGIGQELMRRMLDKLSNVYAVDLVCDPDVQPFYERCGMRRTDGMCLRNYDRQSGSPAAK